MTLLSERRITIEKLLISEGFGVAAVLNYNQQDLTGDAARVVHKEIPASRKVFAPGNAVNGFDDPRLSTFILDYDQERFDGSVTRTLEVEEVTGVDADFPVYAAFTTIGPGLNTPPCIEMLLKAIKNKNSETPYRISEETLEAYESAAMARVFPTITGTLGGEQPVFVIVACPSSSTHTQRLAQKLQALLAAGRAGIPRAAPDVEMAQMLAGRPVARGLSNFLPSRAAGVLGDILRKVSYQEAAARVPGDDGVQLAAGDRHVRYVPSNRVRDRHTKLHKIWNEFAAEKYDTAKYFKTLRPMPFWLINTARQVVAGGGNAVRLRRIIKFALNVSLRDLPAPLDVDFVLNGLCNANLINEEGLEDNGQRGNVARDLLGLLIADDLETTEDNKDVISKRLSSLFADIGSTADSWASLKKDAIKQYKIALDAATDRAHEDTNHNRMKSATMEDTYRLPVEDWIRRGQNNLDQHVVDRQEEPGDFSISKIPAFGGNRKHTEGFIIIRDNEAATAAINQIQTLNQGNRPRPYVLVVVDDNVESGTTMREVARAASEKFQQVTGVPFRKVVGATALAIRGTTVVRCSKIIEDTYNFPATVNNP